VIFQAKYFMEALPS